MNEDNKPAEDAAAAEMAGAAARGADQAPAEEAAPATCDHNWRLCPFYCPSCDTTYAISDEPVAWRRRVRTFQGDVTPGRVALGVMLTELASWSEGEDPPSWP